MSSTYILTCLAATYPIKFLHAKFPGKTFYEIFCWESNLGSFFKSKALLWSRQICTKNTVLVIHSADRLSVPMMSLITGVLDQGFSRPIVFVVQSSHKLPYSIRRKSEMIYLQDSPPLAEGWTELLPGVSDHVGWENILLA